jgi:hypothetical protein
MPGYNHYSWCTCGWCYKTGSGGYSAHPASPVFDVASASQHLARSGASRSWAACFINPNASCPVCGERVFYYQNEYGSKVYFDDIPWPWPKHGCTDNLARASFVPHWKSPTVRPSAEVIEIAEAARTIEFDPASRFRNRFGEDAWDILYVVEIVRNGFNNFIQAKAAAPSLNETVYIAFVSANVVPSVGEFFGLKGDEVSFLQLDTLEARRLRCKVISEAEFKSIG